MSEKPTVTEVIRIEKSNVLDLDEYRKMRIAIGDFPPTFEDHVKFFTSWKESRKK